MGGYRRGFHPPRQVRSWMQARALAGSSMGLDSRESGLPLRLALDWPRDGARGNRHYGDARDHQASLCWATHRSNTSGAHRGLLEPGTSADFFTNACTHFTNACTYGRRTDTHRASGSTGQSDWSIAQFHSIAGRQSRPTAASAWSRRGLSGVPAQPRAIGA
jgi:hypothetical protein